MQNITPVFTPVNEFYNNKDEQKYVSLSICMNFISMYMKYEAT